MFFSCRYNLPFLEIVGFTSTWKNYTLVGAFLSHETTEDYTWAIRQLVKLCVNAQKTPKCMVTDREKALIKPLDALFTSSKHLLCRFQNLKNIEGKAKNVIKNVAIAKYFSNDYRSLFKTTSEKRYNEELARIKQK